MTTTYRAACWIAADGQSHVRLTTEDQAGLTDDALMAAAQACIADTGLEREEGDRIVIGEYTDA